MELLGGLTQREFIRRHWQKRPLFVRGALTGLHDMLDPAALLALAASDEVESRLVERSGKRWRVTHGPISGRRMRDARASIWTILVSGVNFHLAQADRLLQRFAFLPRARLDDVMVSYAARGGGVGPHVDSYDVFLLQGGGRRRWRVAPPRRYQLIEGNPLRQIKRFVAQSEYIAEAGDLLYVPPGWAHEGVALEPCLTYSIGFRAPRGAELGAAFLDWLHERGLPEAQYRDPALRPTTRSARIPQGLVEFAVRTLGKITWSRGDIADFIGRYLTAPKPHLVFRQRARGAPRLESADVVLDPKTQLLYRGNRLFINGESLRARPSDAARLRLLADRRRLAGKRLVPLAPLIAQWRRSGFVHLERTQ